MFLQGFCYNDYARDLGHPGSLTNKSYVDKILEILNTPLT